MLSSKNLPKKWVPTMFKNISYNIQWMFFSTLLLLNSFQIIPRVSIIYYKHCHVNTLKTHNINIFFDHKTWKIQHWLHLLWFLLMWMHLVECKNVFLCLGLDENHNLIMLRSELNHDFLKKCNSMHVHLNFYLQFSSSLFFVLIHQCSSIHLYTNIY